MSHPTWVRGLKLIVCHGRRHTIESHPTWVRGLKHNALYSQYTMSDVAPYVGAWIETGNVTLSSREFIGRTLRGCVD